MYQGFELSNSCRLRISFLTAMAGGATALTITQFGGRLLHMLPESGFHLAAVIGAGIAGFILADGFGRPGWPGFLLAMLAGGLATLTGAWLGALILMPPNAAGIGTGILGWIMLAEAISADPMIPKVWAGVMATLHLAVLHVRMKAGCVSP